MHQVVQLLRHHGITRVLDVGANEGGYATELRRFGYAGRIVSFEPVSESFRLLQSHARKDHLWTTLPYAVGAVGRRLLIWEVLMRCAQHRPQAVAQVVVPSGPVLAFMSLNVVSSRALASETRAVAHPAVPR